MTYSDLGAVLIISSIYRIVESNLLVNIFYLLCGGITSLAIFSIAKNVMSLRYSYLCAISYSLSSYVLWFHSSGLKESFMVMIVVLFFDQCYKIYNNYKIINILMSVIFVIILLLFRPPLLFFCIGSFGLTLLLIKGKGTPSKILLFLGAIVLIASYSYIDIILSRYLSGDIKSMLSTRESAGLVVGNLSFTYLVNILGQMIGPFPSVIPNYRTILSFFSAGLIYRVFLSLALWFGVYAAFKYKVNKIYPLIFFLLMEMLSLTFIVEGLELRKSLPHFPAIYIVSFWALYLYENNIYNTINRHSSFKRYYKLSIIILCIIVIFWNVRYFVIST
ncbi:MAG: hypothetical protein WD431_17215 [Cyclobacteriaceae bacterium]